MKFQEELAAGIVELKLEVSAEQQRVLLAYLALLKKWNAAYNLTAVKSEEMVSYHLLDSLAVLPHLWDGRWLDVGCGAGLPGVVLAAVKPEMEFVMLDSNSKKTGFVQQAIIELKLKNVSVCCCRIEDYKTDKKFDGIISRAFSELGTFVNSTRNLMSETGNWAAMKGWAEKELHSLPADCRVKKIVSLKVPGLMAERSLVVVSHGGAK